MKNARTRARSLPHFGLLEPRLLLSVSATPVISIKANKPKASEIKPTTTGTGQFTFSRTGSKTDPLTITYTIDGSATNGDDYSTLSGTLTIPAGKSSVTLNIVPTTTVLTAGSQTVILTLDASSDYALSTKTTATVIIADTQLAAADLFSRQLSNTIKSGTGQFTSSGSRVLTLGPSDDAGYASIGSKNVGSSYGFYAYNQTGAASATASFSDTQIGNGTMTFTFTSTTAGSYSFLLSDNSTETGTFKLAPLAKPFAPSTLTGDTTIDKITTGSTPFATKGSYQIAFLDSSYTLTGLGSVPSTTGNYNAFQLTPNTLLLTLDDSTTGFNFALYTFTSPTRATFTLVDNNTDNTQKGTLTLVT